MFESVQCWGVCPECDLRFLVDYSGKLINHGNRTEDRSNPVSVFVPTDVDQLAGEIPAEIKARVQSEFSPQDVRAAMRLLACYGTREHEVSVERVWLLSLDGASGRLDALESAIQLAQTDWRDFFMMYEHG